jgi:hypothetical protein
MQSAPRTSKRCSWVNEDDPLLLEYHDREWAFPFIATENTSRGSYFRVHKQD